MLKLVGIALALLGTASVANAQAPTPVSGQENTTVVFAWHQLPRDQQLTELRRSNGGRDLAGGTNPCEGLPPSLWLGMSLNKEWPPFYRHAWGEARVSTRQDMGDRYPVARLTFRVEMPALGSPVVDQQTCSAAATCPADAKYGGTIFGGFTARWTATAYHPCYGTWTNDYSW